MKSVPDTGLFRCQAGLGKLQCCSDLTALGQAAVFCFQFPEFPGREQGALEFPDLVLQQFRLSRIQW